MARFVIAVWPGTDGRWHARHDALGVEVAADTADEVVTRATEAIGAAAKPPGPFTVQAQFHLREPTA